MRPMNMRNAILKTRLLLAAVVAMASLATTAHPAAPGINATGTSAVGTFALVANAAYITQPDGQAVYSWGYGCTTAPAAGSFAPAAITTGFCGTMQIPGPTLIVTEGQPVSVTLTNSLP